jgi:exodeoxyribonuclease V alpha subunit
MLQQLYAAWHQGQLSDVALHFAGLIARLDPVADEKVLLGAALTSQCAVSGEVCLNLGEIAGTSVLVGVDGGEIIAPKLSPWLTSLRCSSVVGTNDAYQPLVLENDNRLYLYQYRNLEARLATALRSRAEAPDLDVDSDQLKRALSVVFPVTAEAAEQREAAALVVRRPFAVISGGPGTGKTTTVVRVLALLQELNIVAPDRVALSAPTGKAAARLREAVAQVSTESESVVMPSSSHAVTLHRLLGWRSGGRPPTYGANRAIPYDVVVVDEASMVDLALMTQLLEALPTKARLILLGDRDQLASVEAGAVLGDICAAAESKPLVNSVARLRHSWRFARNSQIGRLATAVTNGDTDEALATLSKPDQLDAIMRPVAKRANLLNLLEEHCLDVYAEGLRLAATGAPAEVAFNSLSQLQLLAAHRRGPGGVDELNQQVEKQLALRGLLRLGDAWYPGRPVLVTRNDYNLRLFNGDIGVVLPDPDQPERLKVIFPRAEGGWRAISPGRLPEHETAYAMTVHKSQGSEFNGVIMVLPERTLPVLSRALLYTAITRATDRLEIWGCTEVLEEAIRRQARRASGLRDRLSAVTVT